MLSSTSDLAKPVAWVLSVELQQKKNYCKFLCMLLCAPMFDVLFAQKKKERKKARSHTGRRNFTFVLWKKKKRLYPIDCRIWCTTLDKKKKKKKRMNRRRSQSCDIKKSSFLIQQWHGTASHATCDCHDVMHCCITAKSGCRFFDIP